MLLDSEKFVGLLSNMSMDDSLVVMNSYPHILFNCVAFHPSLASSGTNNTKLNNSIIGYN